MMKNYLLPSNRRVFKDLKSLNLKDRINALMRNPSYQFLILGVALLVVNLLAQTEIIPISMTLSVSAVIIYAIISIGFCLLLGYSGLASLGTAGFAGVGVYATYYFMQVFIKTPDGGKTGWAPYSFVIALIVAIILAVIIGLFVGFISLRIEGMYLAILTLGLAEILFKVFQNLNQMPKIEMGNIVFFGIKMDNSMKFVVITVIFVLLLVLTNNLINSPTGRAMIAMKNSTSAAQAMGISLIKYRLMAFVISTIYAAIGGVLYIVNTRAIAASSSTFLSLSFSLNILGAVIVGGSKSLLGTTFGALVIFGLQSIFFINIPFFQKNPEFMGILTGVLLVVIVMFYPGGLSQLYLEIKGKIRKKKEQRRIKKYGIN